MKTRYKIERLTDPENIYEWASFCNPKMESIYTSGNDSLLSNRYASKRVAIVGTRNATFAGLHDARRLAQVLCKHGAIIVSGLALGIDGAAHQGALDVGGNTIAVLGSGLDYIYPERHHKMANEIINSGCLVSEYQPGTPALAWHFPIRNRIIAAMSDLIVVPEGTIRGGARITVDLALGMNKTVCALPGPRRNKSSELNNFIIKEGAVCINDPADVLAEIGIYVENQGWELEKSQKKSSKRELNLIEQEIVEALGHGSLSRDDICMHTDLELKESYSILKTLEKDGFITYRRGAYESLR